MSENLLPPFTGGYPVVAVVSVAGDCSTCAWAVLSSDDSGTEVIETGVGTTGRALNEMLAAKALVHAEQRQSLIRVWRTKVVEQIVAAGGELYLDVPANVRTDDDAYVQAMALVEQMCADRAEKRAASGLKKRNDRPLIVAVDGSRSRSGEGSWAWITENGRWETHAGRFSSILQAELSAIHAAIRAHDRGRPLHLLCDSKHAIALANLALAGEAAPAQIPNSVARVFSGIARDSVDKQVTIEWVKGHSGHPLNDRADRLAVHARRRRGEEHEPSYRDVAKAIADMSELALAS